MIQRHQALSAKKWYIRDNPSSNGYTAEDLRRLGPKQLARRMVGYTANIPGTKTLPTLLLIRRVGTISNNAGMHEVRKLSMRAGRRRKGLNRTHDAVPRNTLPHAPHVLRCSVRKHHHIENARGCRHGRDRRDSIRSHPGGNGIIMHATRLVLLASHGCRSKS